MTYSAQRRTEIFNTFDKGVCIFQKKKDALFFGYQVVCSATFVIFLAISHLLHYFGKDIYN